MSAPRGGLGRGLGALLPPAPVPVPAQPAAIADTDDQTVGLFREVAVDDVHPNPRQPRTAFDEGALADLAASIREVGLLQPVVVRDRAEGGYELVMGERRLRAAQLAGLSTIPALVRRTPDSDLLRDALMENLHREQLNPLEEAAAYAQLLEDFGVTHEELAQRVARSRSHVTNTLRLMQLPPPVQRRVAAGVLSAGHARALLALPDASRQEEFASRVVAEGLSVRAVEELVAIALMTTPSAKRRTVSRAERPAELDELSARLSDRFETRVRVDQGRAKGKITIEFGSPEDLQRIVAQLVPSGERAELGGPSDFAERSDFAELTEG